ncbi:MAG: alanine racemase [Puniceicoccaceae bacterium]|nr:alanine racemase [Puniceicoccaceae bacterium]
MIPLRAWTEIDLSAYERNLKKIKRALPQNVAFISVVKADAYGHGLPQIVERSLQSGIKTFAVANIQEAFEIRNVGVGWPILLLGALMPGEEQYIPNSQFIPTISSLEELIRLERVCQRKESKAQIHLKIDTGMGRLGVWHADSIECIERIQASAHLELTGIYTHFSDPVNDREFTLVQRKRLESVVAKLTPSSPLCIHADSSASLDALHGSSAYNAVRIGLLQYGVQPYSDMHELPFSLTPTLSFYTKVGLVKNLPEGTSISYGRSHVLKSDSKIAILTAGYGDGVPLAYSGRGSVIIQDTLCPILGRITMDQIIVDVTALDSVQSGDTVTLIGQTENCTISLEQFCQDSDSIPWEVLCSITKRVQRIYINPRT